MSYKIINKQIDFELERLKGMIYPTANGIEEYIVTRANRNVERIITNDPEHFFALDLVVEFEKVDRGSYAYALLEKMFGDRKFAVNITSFYRTIQFEDKGVLKTKKVEQNCVTLGYKPNSVVFAHADFDAETVIRIEGFDSDQFADMTEFGIVVGNSDKMTKRLVELTKAVRGYVLNDGERRLRIKVISHEDIARAFPHLLPENVEKVADGISFMATQVANSAYKWNPAMSPKAKAKMLRDIKAGKITNHTLRVLTNIGGQACLIKGNVLTNDRAVLNARMRELGIIGPDETYDIFTSVDNVKTELGTDGSFEILTLEPHHGPGMVKTNDQMLGQYYGIKGVCDPEELLEAFGKLMDQAYNDMVEGRDITMFENMATERASTETEKIAALRGNEATSNIHRMMEVIADLELPLAVSQTLMFARANGILKMFLDPDMKKGENWKAPSRKKRSFMFQPWAYRAYIMAKESVYMAGFDVDMTSEEGEYHEETQTFMIPGNKVADILGKLGGADFDDEVGIHVRKMIMKDGSVRLVAFMVRTPNDWAEFYILDISEFGPVFLAEDHDIDLPTIYEVDFDKFNQVAVAGQLPSKVNGSGRPKPAVWDWSCARYNAGLSVFRGGSVGGQVKTKMLWYALHNAPFATLPCPNEDMIDGYQQCKADMNDLQVLDYWSQETLLKIVTDPKKMDAYWWHSRNMRGTVDNLNRIAEEYFGLSDIVPTYPLKSYESPIVRDMMIPREKLVRETHQKMVDWLNNHIMEIPELRGVVANRDEETQMRKAVGTLHDLFQNRVQGETVGEHYQRCATEILSKMEAYKAKIGEEKFHMYILKLARVSWIRKNEAIKRNWNQYLNYDRWLYTCVDGADKVMTEYFHDAMVWYRKKREEGNKS
jgi:hypothetical protein